jgi:hypothetical protein
MAQAEQRPLAEVLFGPCDGTPPRPEGDLADAIQAWYRTRRAQIRDSAAGSRAAAAKEAVWCSGGTGGFPEKRRR